MNPIRWLAVRLASYAYKAERRQPITLIASWLAGILWHFESTWHELVRHTYGENPIAYSCVRLLSQSIPEARLTAYIGDGDDREELPATHPLRLLLKRPNELMTRFEQDELTTIQMAVVGRSVWWKERANNGKPIAMWPLRPDRVGPVYSASQEPGQRVLAGWAYQAPDGSTPILIPRRDALTFNFPDPDGESGGIVEGFGPLCAVARQIAADNKATDHVGALLANYAQPGVALEIQDSVTEDEANIIKAKFRQEFSGARLGMPGLLQAGAKVTPLGFTLQELEFPELRANAEARICGALGVPAILAGAKVGLTESNQRATTGELRRFFAETTLSWYWRRYADQYTADLASEFGEDIACEYDTSNVRALAGQKIEAIAPVKEAFAAGVLTRNQYLHALGMEPLEPGVGDVFLVPNSVTEVAATDEARRLRGARAPSPALPAPQPVPQLPAGRQQAGEQQPGLQQEEEREAQETEGEGQEVAAKSVVVIRIDDELAAALGVKAGGQIIVPEDEDGTKYNPYHDSRGRFTGPGGTYGGSYAPQNAGGMILRVPEKPAKPAVIGGGVISRDLADRAASSLVDAAEKRRGKRIASLSSAYSQSGISVQWNEDGTFTITTGKGDKLIRVSNAAEARSNISDILYQSTITGGVPERMRPTDRWRTAVEGAANGEV